jgi:tetratricopeptide (TPR) repeat protein
VVAVAGLAVPLAGWVGLGAVTGRLATLATGEAARDERLPFWADVARLVPPFAAWGTGYGTFRYAEPLTRSPRPEGDWYVDHAHNEYLEALVEGGAGRLLLTLGLIGAAVAGGVRTYRRAAAGMAPLALGALAGLVAVAVHGAVDFGIHVPAVAVVVAIVAAHLNPGAEGRSRERPGVADGCLLALGVLVALQGWWAAEGDRYAQEAERLHPGPEPAVRERRVALLRAAVACTPDDAERQADLALARLAATPEAARPGLLTAVRHCPLLARAHLGLAALAGGADRAAHLDRACRLAPSDGPLWLRAGAEALGRGDRGQAWACWRHALLGSNLLDGPALEGERRRAFLAQSLDLLQGRPPPWPAADWHLAGRLRRDLGDGAGAVTAGRQAVALEPQNAAWRYGLAALLRDQGRLPEARAELRRLLEADPGHAAGRALLEAVISQQAARE